MFFLAYGGMGWGYGEMLDMPHASRRWYVKRLEMQLREEARKTKQK